MISPLTSGLIFTWRTGWIFPLATTISVRFRRVTFSVWMVITGSRFLKIATTVNPASTRPMAEKMMILRRFLFFGFGIVESC